MTTKNEETLLGIEISLELLLDKPIFFSLICHNSRKYRVVDGEYIFCQLSINLFRGRTTIQMQFAG